MTTYLESLRSGLHDAMADDPRVYMFGEDIADPYGGAFKVSKGLGTAYPDRVKSTPISEAAITGIATGMALRGMRPVVEIMFGDFLTLCADQIINHAAKFRGMFDDQVSVPMVLRTPMGGGRGYGATHSQSIEKIFFGTPGINIVAPTHLHDPGALLRKSILETGDPVLFLEHKMLYPAELLNGEPGIWTGTADDGDGWPTVLARNFNTEEPDVTIIAYGGVARHVVSLMKDLADEEIRILAVFPARITPFPVDAIVAAAARTGRVIVAEEGTAGFNWGSEIASVLNEHLFGELHKPVRRVSSAAGVIGASAESEETVLIDDADLEDAIMEILQ